MSIGVAIIGGGIFAKEMHLPNVLANPDFSLKAVYSRSLAACASLCEGVASKTDWYSDETPGRGYEELLTNTNIKAVVIALPIPNQAAYVRRALEAGKHVLSEKPIAETVAVARDLSTWYKEHANKAKATWSVAENWRMLDSHVFAAAEVKKLGRVLGFRAQVNKMTKPGGKYYETAWRKTPSYQGGFLLDGGIHYIAATRLLLGPADAITRVSAFTNQLQEHLPPVDTVHAAIQTKSGASGVFSVSFGTTLTGTEYTVACEKGFVTLRPSKVIVTKDGNEQVFDFPDEGYGVHQELNAWSEDILSGKQNPRLAPEEALKDLEVLEAMLKSGSSGGAPVDVNPDLGIVVLEHPQP